MRRKRIKFYGLRLKTVDRWMIAVVLSLIAFVLVLFRVYTYSAQKSQVDLICMMMEKMSENQKTQFEDYVENKISVLEALVTYPEIYQMNPEAQREFLLNRSDELGFNHMFIVDPDGEGYYIDENTYRDHRGEDFLYNIMKQDVYVTEPFHTGSGTTIMTACVSIHNEEGQRVGVLCGAIDLKNIQQLIESNEMLLDGNCFIVDQDGAFVTADDTVAAYNVKSVYDISDSDVQLIRQAFEGKSNAEGMIIIKGVKYQTYVAYLQNYNWAIVQCIPASEITARYEFLSFLHGVLAVLIIVLLVCTIRIVYCWRKSDEKIYMDTLTKCQSRAACVSLLEELEENRKQEIIIVYMDLNNFKTVNDTYGHEKGDELLRIFGNVLDSVLGQQGFVGRMGGDEFIAVFRDMPVAEIMTLCEQVEKQLNEESKVLDIPYVLSCSYGYCIREKGSAETLDEIMKKADENMYQNKIAGKREEA